MKHLVRSSFVAIFQNEVLLNSKRFAPYFMALLCAGNALLWWGWGPATSHGWAVNADFFIAGVLPVYSFMTLPLFTALFMADPVSRDFRAGVDPLIFSKPISRLSYLLGKFFANFFVLACCQSAFVLTWFLLQGVSKQGVITQEWKILPYAKHFLVFVVISHLGLAAFYFAVGVLTRNAKIVYGLGVGFYPIYIAYQTVLLSSLPWRWKLALDPLVMNRGGRNFQAITAEVMNHFVVVYDRDLILNRGVVILLAGICLTVVWARFTIAERSGKVENFSVLNLSTAAEGVYYPQSSSATGFDEFEKPLHEASAFLPRVSIPDVARANEGIRANVNKLIAAMVVEFRLLGAERSLVVIMPMAIFLSVLEVGFYNVTPDVSYSVAYAVNTARLLLLFLFGITVFYTVEAMHRDREMRAEPILWSLPVPNGVLILSKFLTTTLLAVGLLVMVGLISLAIQTVRGHWPLEVSPYLITYTVILLPTILFTTAAVIVLNVVLRDKYVVYAVTVATGSGLIYFYNLGYNHWLYNPTLYQLWTYQNLTDATGGQGRILIHRIYCVALAVLFLAVAHLGFLRKPAAGLITNGKLGSKGWSLVITLASLAMAIVAGLMVK